MKYKSQLEKENNVFDCTFYSTCPDQSKELGQFTIYKMYSNFNLEF